MSEPQFDVIARQLARGRNRRGVIKAMLGLVLGGFAASRTRATGAAFQEDCGSGWETYCTEITGAEQCIDFSTDSNHCGQCNNRCPDGTRCVDFSCTGSVNGEPPINAILASVECVFDPRDRFPPQDLFNVTITNNTDSPVRVAHVGSLLGPVLPGFPTFVVDAGEVWNGLLPQDFVDAPAVHGAIVTTEAGALVLPCGYTDIPFSTEPIDHDNLRETAATMARTLSVLETYSAPGFDGLYALLHPDVRDLVSYHQLACWYWGYYQAERPAGEATVDSVRIGSWTWGGNGTRYEDTAEVSYRQPYYVGDPGASGLPRTEERSATIHLVQADGVWRWFFGTDPDWLAALPATC